ncbi:ATPase H(+)-transporting accessory protein 2 [Drosophila grimshawi]|uniref:GH20389 n=1 Tax=Drosophila grimshawi TaxID=7222 RepID=B4J3X8_DROGR|nr:ATPase H(+)-transporting accessory protein 2 [Drosophila grimshawi]EDW01561.1 GH20389 [Drosophila grimshawi]
MLLNCLTFLLFISVIQATGEFTVLNNPKSIEFKGEDELESFYVGDVLLASLGNAVTGNSKWSGLFIKDPFTLSNTSVIVVHIQGVYRVPTVERVMAYELLDSDAGKSLDSLAAQLSPASVADFDFNNHSKGVIAFESYFGNIDVSMAMPLKYFKPIEYLSHQHFLEEIGYMNALADNLTSLLRSSQVIIFRLSLDRITKVTKYGILHEAKQIITGAVGYLLSAAKNCTDSLLFVQATDKRVASMRSRSSETSNPFEQFNDSGYPVVCNIIVWLSLALFISLAVICYVLATIDPGKDSVIYRISATHAHMSKKKR